MASRVTLLFGLLAAMSCTVPRSPILERWRSDLPADAMNLLSPSVAYRSQGVLQSSGGASFVASVRSLAGPSADSTHVMLTLSLANRDLEFERLGDRFEAAYIVHATFRGEDGERTVSGSELARVANTREARQAEESILFRRDTWLPPGDYDVTIRLRDVNQRELASVQDSVSIPRFMGPALAPPVPMYAGGQRAGPSSPLEGIVNPRGWYRFGFDSVRVYVEAVGVEGPADATTRVTTLRGDTLFEETRQLSGAQRTEGFVVVVPSAALSVGHLVVTVALEDAPPVATRLFVTLTDRWAVPDFAALDTMLAFYGEPADSVRMAAPDGRATAWRKFWDETDDVRTTEQNEMLDRFFGVIQQANAEFTEPNVPGWMTDRGRVLLTLGLPDFYIDDGPIAIAAGQGPIMWEYEQLQIIVRFVRGRGGTFRWTLSEQSRVDYRKAVLRYRQLYGDRRPWIAARGS